MEYVRLITSHFLSKFPASSRDDDLESQSSQPRASSSSNTTAESQSPQARPPPHSPEPPSGVRHSQRINILDEKPDLEKELRKSLMSLCFLAAIQITIQYRQVDESEIDDFIHLLSSAIAIIFACLFTSHFIGKKIPKASRMLEKAAFILAATTFFSAIANPLRLRIKCAIWAIYILSLIFILVVQNFTHPHAHTETLNRTNLAFLSSSSAAAASPPHSLHQFSSSHSLWPPHPLLPICSHHYRHSLPRQPLRPFRNPILTTNKPTLPTQHLPLTHQSPYSLSSFPSSAYPTNRLVVMFLLLHLRLLLLLSNKTPLLGATVADIAAAVYNRDILLLILLLLFIKECCCL
uniref:Uncharacterized protein n=1 Tax=Salix viminalis TaxID=40686 RepID=A0A6N2LHP3_SALVM